MIPSLTFPRYQAELSEPFKVITVNIKGQALYDDTFTVYTINAGVRTSNGSLL